MTGNTASQSITVDLQGAAEFLNVDKSTVKCKAGRGEIIGAKIGRSWVFRIEDLDNYLRAQALKQTEARKARAATSTSNVNGFRRRRALPILHIQLEHDTKPATITALPNRSL